MQHQKAKQRSCESQKRNWTWWRSTETGDCNPEIQDKRTNTRTKERRTEEATSGDNETERWSEHPNGQGN